ncbi:hypothetical protein N7536_002852 [Penicillium majusculum]|nr:hypothetical protein N7536_002852 [Penicillium majusculum]
MRKRLRRSVFFDRRTRSQLLPNSSVESRFFIVKILYAAFPKAIDRFPTSDLYERFGEPKLEAVIRIDGNLLSEGVPANVYVPGWFGACSDDIILGEEKIIINDFGESFNPHKTLSILQPPEARFFDEPLSFASDIWTLACTIWEIFGQRPLFEAFYPIYCTGWIEIRFTTYT